MAKRSTKPARSKKGELKAIVMGMLQDRKTPVQILQHLTVDLRKTHTNAKGALKKYSKEYYATTPTKTVRNLMTGKPVVIPVNTPYCCDPSTETYWSM